ncbi:MAG: superinfection immunity protein [Bryobacterales bacterium]|nr:superinfection immunity protein [Bryobacterales bacterium]
MEIAFAVMIAYFLPGFIAAFRGHRNALPIIVVNAFLGWTFIGWVVALAWSVSGQSKEPPEKDAEKNLSTNIIADLTDIPLAVWLAGAFLVWLLVMLVLRG